MIDGAQSDREREESDEREKPFYIHTLYMLCKPGTNES